MSGTSFRLTAAAAGAGMANFIAPNFSVFPNYTSGTGADDIAIFNIHTLAPDVYALSGNRISTSTSTFVTLWSGTPDGGSVFSLLTGNTSNSKRPPNFYPDKGFGDFAIDQEFYYKFDSTTPFPDPSGTVEGRKLIYNVPDPQSAGQSYTSRVASGSNVFHTIQNSIGSGEVLVEKLTGGVSQWVYDYYISGTFTAPRSLIPLSDGGCLVQTSRGTVRVNSSGSVLWGRKFNTIDGGLSDDTGRLDAANSYLYTTSTGARIIYRVNIATGVSQSLDMGAVTSLSSSKSSNYTTNRVCTVAVAIDGNGNIWTIGNGSNSDTLACFHPNGTFVRKYSIDNIGNSTRIDLRSIAADGDYVIVGGLIPSGTTSTYSAFVAKLAIDGSSTGTGYVGVPSAGSDRQISVLSSASDGGSYSWSANGETTLSFSRRTISGYSLETALGSATTSVSNPRVQSIAL